MAGDLTELRKQRAALDAEIEKAQEEVVKSGEYVVIDGEKIDSTLKVEGELLEPKETDFFFTYRKTADGDIDGEPGEITYKQLVDAFCKRATDILNETVSAGTSAIERINTTRDSALSAIGKTDSEGARKAALDAIAAARANALSAIGESDSEGARGAAISAINQLFQNVANAINNANSAWNSKVQNDNSTWDNKVANNNSEWDKKVQSDNSDLDEKIATANSTIDQKVSDASTSATNAANSANTASTKATEAATSAGNAKTSENNSKTSENNAKISENNAAGSATDAETAKTASVQAKEAAEQAKTDALQAKEDAETAQAAAEKAAADAEATVGQGLTPDRVLVSNADGKFNASDITTAILNYLSGLTGDVQNQLDNKLIKNATVSVIGAVTGNGSFNNGALQLSLNVGQDIQNMLDEFALSKLRGGMPPAIIFPWFNKNWRPQRTLIANGSVIAETDPEWPTLAAALGINLVVATIIASMFAFMNYEIKTIKPAAAGASDDDEEDI